MAPSVGSILCVTLLCAMQTVCTAFLAPSSLPISVFHARDELSGFLNSMRMDTQGVSRRHIVTLAAGVGIFGSVLPNPKSAGAFQDYDSWKADKDRRESNSPEEFTVEFDSGRPLGLDLQEVRFSAGYSRLMIKGIKPQSQAEELERSGALRTQVFVKRSNGLLVEGVEVESAIRLMQREKKQLDSEGKPLKLLLSPPTVYEKYEIKEKIALY